MAILPPVTATPLADGVYLHLHEDIYFAQDALGSSDMIKLHRFREGWWWQSRHNPDRTADQTDAQNYGSALHALLLEGMGAYESRFAVAPHKRDYGERLLLNIEDIKEALNDEGFDISGTSKWKLADWVSAATAHIPDVPCWPAIMEDFERSIKREDDTKRPSITAIEDRMLRAMYEAAMGEPDIRKLLGIGEDLPTLAEVSFFWTDEFGVRRRARFDKPVPKFTLDLKSVGNWQGRDLKFALGDRILQEGYDVQLADQHDARLRMHAMIREKGEDAIHGGNTEERAWLRAIAERDLEFSWAWLFYQKPELSGRAPIVFPLMEYWGGKYHKSGFRKVMKARDFYLSCIAKFGLGAQPNADGEEARPWSRIEPLHFADDAYEPHISLPHYLWDEVAYPGEEHHFDRRLPA